MRENTFVEFRLDYLPKPLAAMSKLRDFLDFHREATAIATCRRKVNGGKFVGSAASELEVLAKAAAAGFHLVDIGLRTAEAMRPTDWKKMRAPGAAILISYHDFKTTKDLEKIYARIRPLHPDFIKIVTTARSLADNVTMMRFLESKGEEGNVVGVCMGDYGIISRVLGLRAGSRFTFASASVGRKRRPDRLRRVP